jgi:hypothetical protein
MPIGQSVPLASMRVHGTAAQVQFDPTDDQGLSIDPKNNQVRLDGSGTTVIGNRSNASIHFSIPAPMTLETNKILIVSKAFFYFATPGPSVLLNKIELWDGKQTILSKDFTAGGSRMGLSGALDLSDKVGDANSFDKLYHIVRFSLGISIYVKFGVYLDTSEAVFGLPISFYGAGADFYSFTPLTEAHLHFPP